MATSAGPLPTVFNRAALFERVDHNEMLLGAILEVFLDDAPHTMRAIERALAREDVAALRLHAHALKGAAANISAEALRDAAGALETVAEAADYEAFPAEAARVRAAMVRLRPVLEVALQTGGAAA